MILSCDPSTKKCAFALFDKNGQLISFYKVDTSLDILISFFKSMKNKYTIFAVEDQYLNLNVKTLESLVEVRSMLVTLARVFGKKNIKYFVIPPQRWQSTMLGVIQARREQRKKIACLVASKIAGNTIKDNDIADAICIGDYVKRQMALQKRAIIGG